jgi:hypothetical protein
MKKNRTKAQTIQTIEFQRADPEALARFDQNTKRCTMNCGPHMQDPRTRKERMFLCDDCETIAPSNAELKMRQTMWAELKVDCYDGPNCDQHRPYWDGYAEGDKQGGPIGNTITLSAMTFPAGTKVKIFVPACPQCNETSETCECGFDWRKWAEEQYA